MLEILNFTNLWILKFLRFFIPPDPAAAFCPPSGLPILGVLCVCSLTAQVWSTICCPRISSTVSSPDWSWSMQCILRVYGNHGFSLRTQRSARLWQLMGSPTKCRCWPSSPCSGAVSSHSVRLSPRMCQPQKGPRVLSLSSRANLPFYFL